MRIAVVNWSSRRFGGTGSYLSDVMPALHAAGHDVALWHEVDTPSDYPILRLPASAPVWSVAELGVDAAVRELRNWQPDLLYAHGLLDPATERSLLDVAPVVFFAHDYYGTCISGLKTMARPAVAPCSRQFGWPCLASYYPRRCGGLNPVTMVQQFRRQRDRFHLLSRYAAIVTHSEHMEHEYVRHGFPPARVHNVRFGRSAVDGFVPQTREWHALGAWRLLCVGRMDPLKGGQTLLQALPAVARQLARPVHVTFAGDGPARAAWERAAAEICRGEQAIDVVFRGWLTPGALARLYDESDLFVLPSLWPEPLGLVGLEAGRHGLPAVAFDVGGITDWLKAGINGMLAPGSPPTAAGLADAIAAALRDPAIYTALAAGAVRPPTELSFDAHLLRLLHVFEQVVQ